MLKTRREASVKAKMMEETKDLQRKTDEIEELCPAVLLLFGSFAPKFVGSSAKASF